VPLGGRETQVFRFTHWLDEKVEYSCSFASGAAAVFECPPKVAAEPAGASGREVEVTVAFEPSTLGENIRDMLIVSSPAAGMYQCPVVGRCMPPKPQGPIEFAGGAGKVDFKNVFSADADFIFAVDNPAFSVKPSEKIGTKKTASIAVAWKEGVPGGSTAGKLTVACPSQTQCTWVYYLSSAQRAATPGAAPAKKK